MRIRIFLMWGSIWIGITLIAAMGTPARAQNLHAGKTRLDVTSITHDQAPKLDGDLSDPVWRTAAVTDQFFQINPVQGGIPSERTELRMAYSKSHLYIAATLYHQNQDDITALVMTRDTDVDKDDYLQIFIDSYDTARDSYFFMVSPTGARRDGLTENNRKYAAEWDTIWNAKTRHTDKGWTAEIAIPFRSISYDSNIDSWGLQVRRRIQKTNEDIAWVVTDQSLATYDISDMGRLGGIENTERGRGLDVEGFVTGTSRYDWESGTTKTKIEPSANLYYRITPSLTGTLTLNTDFSDTPLDPRQVNTDRFSLFFPESREFFLQDQNLFAFGGRPLRSVNGLPFFSRRIGIVGGLPVDIDGGLKLSGSVGAVNIAALTTRTGERGELDAQTLSVARASVDVGEGTRFGAIFTDGDPTGATHNSVYGVDAQYKSTTLIPGKQFAADAYYLKSDSDVDTQSGDSWGVEVAYPNDLVNWFVRAKQLDENYRPALGFANRTGIRNYTSQLRFRNRYKNRKARYDSWGLFTSLTTDLSDDVESGQHGAFFQRVWNDGSQGLAFAIFATENLDTAFNLPGGASVPVGNYDWQRGNLVYDTGGSRDWRLRTEVECCDYYDGERFTYLGSAEYRPSKHLNLKANYRLDDISVSGGDVEIQVFSGDVIVNITPDMQIESQIQYDNISEGLGYFGRFRWALRAETELLVTLSHGAQTDFDNFRAVQSGVSVRLGNTYRF